MWRDDSSYRPDFQSAQANSVSAGAGERGACMHEHIGGGYQPQTQLIGTKVAPERSGSVHATLFSASKVPYVLHAGWPHRTDCCLRGFERCAKP
jgi:hypothetical protein